MLSPSPLPQRKLHIGTSRLQLYLRQRPPARTACPLQSKLKAVRARNAKINLTGAICFAPHPAAPAHRRRLAHAQLGATPLQLCFRHCISKSFLLRLGNITRIRLLQLQDSICRPLPSLLDVSHIDGWSPSDRSPCSSRGADLSTPRLSDSVRVPPRQCSI